MALTLSRPGMDNLPSELVTQALKSLDCADLRSAAAVSRSFYGSAWRAGLYIHRNVQLCDEYTGGCKLLETIVRHVLKKRLRLSLSVNLVPDTNTSGYHGSGRSPVVHPEDRIIAYIYSAFPVLVYLSITSTNGLLPAVMAALRQPAPQLVAFSFDVRQGDGIRTIPTHLFAGSAPKLRRLHLSDTLLGNEPIPLLSRLRSVSLSYTDRLPSIDYAHHFPLLQNLHLASWTDPDEPGPRSFKIGGLRLRRLKLEEAGGNAFMPAILHSINLADVPSFEYTADMDDWTDPLLDREDGPLSIRLTSDARPGQEISVIIIPEHRRWRRVYIPLAWSAEAPLPALDILGHSKRLVYLRMDSMHVYSLLTCFNNALCALRKLQLDFYAPAGESATVWPSFLPTLKWREGPSSSNARNAVSHSSCSNCSAIVKVSLFAMVGEIFVASDEVVYLGRALPQCPRREQDRLVLELVGIELEPVVPESDLSDTFSAICRREFVGGNSIASQDDGMWDDDF